MLVHLDNLGLHMLGIRNPLHQMRVQIGIKELRNHIIMYEKQFPSRPEEMTTKSSSFASDMMDEEVDMPTAISSASDIDEFIDGLYQKYGDSKHFGRSIVELVHKALPMLNEDSRQSLKNIVDTTPAAHKMT